ncbi:NmrA family NAD(P)-binding protein, partial [Parvimonas sp. D9]
MNILIAGASGSVGEGLVEAFLEKGHYVTAVVRNEDKRIKLE